MSRPDAIERIRYDDLADRLEELEVEAVFELDADRGVFVGASHDGSERLVLLPSPLQPIPKNVTTLAGYRESLSLDLGTWVVLLLQAGAASFGYWDDDELIRHKVIKQYVVRGTGRAQTKHLKTKGKSRYGSRLRLRNAVQLLVDVNEKLDDWWDEHGAPDRVLASCPVRMWPELWHVKPPPPFERDDADRGIPLDVAVPSFEELQRVGRFLMCARVERWSASSQGPTA